MDESTDVVQATLHILSNISQCQLSMFSLVKKYTIYTVFMQVYNVTNSYYGLN